MALRHGALCVALIAAFAGSAYAQSAPASAQGQRSSTGDPRRDTMIRMTRPIAIEFKETRLEDVMRFIIETTQADVEVMWQDDRNATGLDKDAPVSIDFSKGGTALSLVEKILEKYGSDDVSGTGGSTWQVSESGTMQVGPKTRLNRWKRLQIYPIHDLILEVPNYANAPEFDLQAVLQSSGQQGGSSQSPFRDNQNQNAPTARPYDDRINDLQNLLTTLVETEQWIDNGGDGASIRPFQGSFLINAPDYVHRQIDGYPWWPSSATKASMNRGRRYVTLGVDTSTAKIDGFGQVPVTAVTGNGRLVTSNPGPGGNATPANEQPAASPKK